MEGNEGGWFYVGLAGGDSRFARIPRATTTCRTLLFMLLLNKSVDVDTLDRWRRFKLLW